MLFQFDKTPRQNRIWVMMGESFRALCSVDWLQVGTLNKHLAIDEVILFPLSEIIYI